MKRMMFAGLVALAGTVAGSALAADMTPRYPQQPYVKAPLYNPVFSWTGFYLGLNGGGGWGHSSWDRTGEIDLSGGFIGGTAGFNWQTGQMVLGIEGDVDWSGMSGTSAAFCSAGCTTKNDWLGTVRGRVGYSFDRFLPYFTGGAAFGAVKGSVTGFGSFSQTKVGWTGGAGLEYAFTDNWTTKLEYLYVDLGKATCNAACSGGDPFDVTFKTNIVRAGVNYKF